jgi:hypothetical protein
MGVFGLGAREEGLAVPQVMTVGAVGRWRIQFGWGGIEGEVSDRRSRLLRLHGRRACVAGWSGAFAEIGLLRSGEQGASADRAPGPRPFGRDLGRVSWGRGS